MLTPIFHPNIAPHAICIGDHWSAGAPLASIVARIGEMIAYQSYNTKSPLNGEAARWVDQNPDRLPLDPVSLLVDDEPTAAAMTAQTAPKQAARPQQASAAAAPRAAAPSPAQAAPAPSREFKCPQCESLLRVRPEMAGKRVRCPRCQTVSTLPANLVE